MVYKDNGYYLPKSKFTVSQYGFSKVLQKSALYKWFISDLKY